MNGKILVTGGLGVVGTLLVKELRKHGHKDTSFNVGGEPIVCTPENAYRCFMRSDMDILIMNDFLLYKTE